MRRVTAVIVLACLAAAVSATGWRGPAGSGAWPDAAIPATWSVGQHVRWCAPLPNWGTGAPIADGDSVFVLCEPLVEGPVLVCLDARTGQVRWEREVSHLDLLQPEQAEEARRLWREAYAWERRSREYWHELRQVWDDVARRTDVLDRMTADGIALARPAQKPVDLRSAFVAVDREGQQARLKTLVTRYGLPFDSWHRWGAIIGNAFPSPVTDGATVYVATGFNTVAAYRFDGTRRWMRWLGVPAHVATGKATDWPSTYFLASPILVGRTLITGMGSALVALDADTGRLLWRRERPSRADQGGTPIALRLGDVDVVVTGGGEVVRVLDGKVLAALPYSCHGTGVAHDDTVYVLNSGSGGGSMVETAGIYAVRLTLQGGDQLTTELRWSHTFGRCELVASLVYHDGRVYLAGAAGLRVIDAETGAMTTTGVKADNWISPVLVGRYVLLQNNKGVCQVFSLGPRPTRVAENTLPVPPLTPERERLHIRMTGDPTWGWGSASPTAGADTLYLRTNDYLYAIGEPR